MIRMEMANGDEILLELSPETAPLTVANFEKLVRAGFYDGLTFHRVIPGFMIQGGCPLGNGTGGAGTCIKGEFAQNGIQNPLHHTRGVISMARSSMPNSASSQFFIMHRDAPHLDGAYAAFGRVVKGMEVVDAIAAVPTNRADQPLTPVTIRSMTVVAAASDPS
ncbi:MAG: peptidylprolyl isomerase [Eubacteriales bacterium]